MTDIDTIVNTVKQSVTAIQAAQALGIRVDRSGRCACPIHHGKGMNMKLWEDDRGFYCYKCHASGDVIRLIQSVNTCGFWGAVAWLDAAFNLALPLDRQMDDREAEAARMARERKQMERDLRKAIERMEYDLYCIAGKLANELEADAEQYRPRRPYAEWDGRFVAALRLLPEARETMEHLAVETMGKRGMHNECA